MGADADSVAELKRRGGCVCAGGGWDGRANAGHDADDLVAHDAGVVGWPPARAERVEVRAADTAVGDLDFDVGGREGFRGERGEREWRGGRVGDPAVELVGHFGVVVIVVWRSGGSGGSGGEREREETEAVL